MLHRPPTMASARGRVKLPRRRTAFAAAREPMAAVATSSDELLRCNLLFQVRIRELASANDGLRREVAAEARKLQTIMHELALAAERVGDRPLANVIRAVAATPSDLSSVAACGVADAKACKRHGRTSCALCRAVCEAQPLSKREREVLCLLTEGSRSPCIATHLGITTATVEVHRRNIMRKLGLHTVAALTKYAVREGVDVALSAMRR